MNLQIVINWVAATLVAIITTAIPMILLDAPAWAWFGCSMIVFNVQFLGLISQTVVATRSARR